MLEPLTAVQKKVVYEALRHAIRTNFRVGFHNQDTGHPVYRLGIEGRLMPEKDSPERNALYLLMHEISKCELMDEGRTIEIQEPVYGWSDFCRMVVAANEQHEKRHNA